MSEIFDPLALLEQETTVESTKMPPLPMGDYHSVIQKVEPEQIIGKKDPSKTYLKLNITHRISVPADVQQSMGVKFEDGSTTRVHGFLLDMAANGSLDYSTGKNSRLRAYREATGNNVAGKPFKLNDLVGQSVSAAIKHESYEGELRDYVASVAAIN